MTLDPQKVYDEINATRRELGTKFDKATEALYKKIDLMESNVGGQDKRLALIEQIQSNCLERQKEEKLDNFRYNKSKSEKIWDVVKITFSGFIGAISAMYLKMKGWL